MSLSTAAKAPPAVLLAAGHCALRKTGKEHDLKPAEANILLLIDTFAKKGLAPKASSLNSGWIEPSLLCRYVRQLDSLGLLTRHRPRRRAGKVLVLTAKGLGIVSYYNRALRTELRALWTN
jgi:hypothetical protein